MRIDVHAHYWTDDYLDLVEPRYEPIFAELNRRAAVLYLHPAGNSACTPLIGLPPDLDDRRAGGGHHRSADRLFAV